MSEGPLVHRIARSLQRILAGQRCTVDVAGPDLATVRAALAGNAIERVEARGKQFRLHLADQRILLVHLMMDGFWRIRRHDEARRPAKKRQQLVFSTATHIVRLYEAPHIHVFTPDALDSDTRFGNLGPDPLRSDYDPGEVVRRLRAQPRLEIAPALLDQHIIAGIGNMLKSEILFCAGIHPCRTVSSLTPEELRDILSWTQRLMRRWLNGSRKGTGWRFIYGKAEDPCPTCGTQIVKLRQAGRNTYFCPHCQPLATTSRQAELDLA
jgi:formamidopyrimidine-DNA glycosylase